MTVTVWFPGQDTPTVYRNSHSITSDGKAISFVVDGYQHFWPIGRKIFWPIGRKILIEADHG